MVVWKSSRRALHPFKIVIPLYLMPLVLFGFLLTSVAAADEPDGAVALDDYSAGRGAVEQYAEA